MTKKAFKKLSLGTIVSSCLIFLLFLFVVLPILWLFFSTVKPEMEIIGTPQTFIPHTWTIDQYAGVWERIPLLTYLKNSVIYVGGVLILALTFDVMAGYAFARLKFKGRNVMFMVVLMTMMIPRQVIVLPLFVEALMMGTYNTYVGLILPCAADAFGIYMMRSFFIGLPKDYEEAARIDGCHEVSIFFRIMLPLCKPPVITLGVILFMNNWNDLLYPLMMTGTAEKKPISAGIIAFVGQVSVDYGTALTASFISVIPLLAAYALAQKYFVRSIALSGLKG